MDDAYRIHEIHPDARFTPEPYRTHWRRDLARLIHSASFRRLQGKTQLFPGDESDFFRNRLTHSLEVAQIAKSIANKLNYDLEQDGKEKFVEPDVAELAGLAHDLGHPPFGHFGEYVLDEKMMERGGFEGNAQTLRIITRTEKKGVIENTTLGIDDVGVDKRVGLDLTMRSIASILKYDKKIPALKKDRKELPGPQKGYYETEAAVVKTVKEKVYDQQAVVGTFKTVECQIMDIADDIAYSTYDLEDSFKAGFIKPMDLICAPEEVRRNVAKKVSVATGFEIDAEEVRIRLRKIFFDIFDPPLQKDFIGQKLTKELYEFLHFYSVETVNNLSRIYAEDGYYRTDLTSKLVGLAIRKVSIKKVNLKMPVLSEVELEKEHRIDVEILKHYVYESQILSPKVQIIARRSREIIGTIFDALSNKEGKGYMLMPNDFQQVYLAFQEERQKYRVVCDFIAGMTDRYALEFYGRLISENPQTIFKPL